MNDIKYVPGSHHINLFADDTLIYTRNCDLEGVQNINASLKNIEIYLQVNKLKLNVNKSKAIIVSAISNQRMIDTNTVDISIFNSQLAIVNEIKYLGFIIDHQLTLNKHAGYTIRKICKKLYFFSRISKSLSIFARLTCYNCIIGPLFDYCATLMYLFNRNQIGQLQKLQN